MKVYKNLSGHSGIRAYETGPGFIRVRFEDGSTYLYTDDSTGPENVMHMKRLADEGSGLCTFISVNVKNAYAFKENSI
jgi:hypothetical protein